MTSFLVARSLGQEWSHLVSFLMNQSNQMTPTHWMVVCSIVVLMGFMFLRSGGGRL